MSGAETDTDTQLIHADLVDACIQSCGCEDPGKEGECWYAESFAALSRLSGRVTELEQALGPFLLGMRSNAGARRDGDSWIEVTVLESDLARARAALAGSAGQEQA